MATSVRSSYADVLSKRALCVKRAKNSNASAIGEVERLKKDIAGLRTFAGIKDMLAGKHIRGLSAAAFVHGGVVAAHCNVVARIHGEIHVVMSQGTPLRHTV
jgi:hypothetical protein